MSSSQGQEKTPASAKDYAHDFVKVNDDQLRAQERDPGFSRSPFFSSSWAVVQPQRRPGFLVSCACSPRSGADHRSNALRIREELVRERKAERLPDLRPQQLYDSGELFTDFGLIAHLQA
jgi:hypothetical protein